MNSNKPKAYADGWTQFLGCTIFLDSHPLIPRSETEWWTEKAIQSIAMREHPQVVDLFAGSGCIGTAVLKHIQDAVVVFGEKNASHLETITKNALMNGGVNRFKVIETDVWSNIHGTFDVVLANPPYIDRSLGRAEASVVDHEPHDALFAEDGGFALIEATIRGVSKHLLPKGELWIEHEPEHEARMLSLADELGYCITVHQDQYGLSRYSVILLA